MTTATGPDQKLREIFLIRAYFGAVKNGEDDLHRCIDRAYRDFCRTMDGLKKLPDKKQRRRETKDLLHREIERMKGKIEIKEQGEFDAWHRRLCDELCVIYPRECTVPMQIGQAQKYVNMTLKYAFTMGLTGYGHLYRFCHLPLDSLILKHPSLSNLPINKRPWSSLDSYGEYLQIQDVARRANSPEALLDMDFKYWGTAGI